MPGAGREKWHLPSRQRPWTAATGRHHYEPSVRIPLIVTPPGGRTASVATGPTSILDVLPTILALAGVTEHLPVDGHSVLTGDGDTTSPERVVFWEYHSEGVYAPCFMARRGHHKLIYIHGHEHQLFDLAEDPGESRDLAGDDEYAAVEKELLEAILARFDPDRLETDIRAGLARRRVIKQAMARTRTHWDHTPYTDPTQQYWPSTSAGRAGRRQVLVRMTSRWVARVIAT